MVERALLSDYSELLAFEERVFRVRFCGKVPKLYTDPAVCAEAHRVVRENGRIVAAIAAWPGDIVTPAGVLHAVGIGSVAVDESCRGKGYMREMMLQCDEIARAQNAALGYLSGHRRRYGYYGYAPGGVRLGYEISAYDVVRAKPQATYGFTPLRHDPDALPAVYALYAAQDARWQRTEADFSLTAATWRCRAYVIRDGAGKVCGYLITERFRGEIGELVLAEGADAADVLVQFAHYQNGSSCAWPCSRDRPRCKGSSPRLPSIRTSMRRPCSKSTITKRCWKSSARGRRRPCRCPRGRLCWTLRANGGASPSKAASAPQRRQPTAPT